MWSLLRGFVRTNSDQQNSNPGHDVVTPLHTITVEQSENCARRDRNVNKSPSTNECPKPITRNSAHCHSLCGLDDILSDIEIDNRMNPDQSSIDWIAFRAEELWQHNYECDTLYVNTVLRAVHQLIARKSAQKSIPVHHVRAQIELLGQYAILSHRWERPGEELCFADAARLADPRVKAKQGFTKMKAFRGAVESLYGCRYLWVDSVCINEPDRNASIPRMFGWYHRAYVCVIYLPTGKIQPKGFQWTNRGWTLQEYLAARRIKIIGAGLPTRKFDAIRRGTTKDFQAPGRGEAIGACTYPHEHGMELGLGG
ncbi:hypothetical protein EYR36_008194 [Pleurotus pulmonarius]|nr:hypothetical protein EYR36_008194 [Pleurotus pulmonarius]